VLGSILAFGLVRRGGLASWFGAGIALFGAPLALIGVVPDLPPAIVLLGVVGIGNALIDVGGFTILARLADETVLARMFAGFEAILTLGVAAGGLLAPLVIELLGVRLALLAIGLMAPLAVAASWPARRRLDARMRVRDADIEILRGVRMLGALPAATIEQLGAGLEHAEFAPRQTVFEQGERGERFYIVESGRAEVVRDGRHDVSGGGADRVVSLGDEPHGRAGCAGGPDERARGRDRGRARDRPGCPWSSGSSPRGQGSCGAGSGTSAWTARARRSDARARRGRRRG
jgi:hypothetical protein